MDLVLEAVAKSRSVDNITLELRYQFGATPSVSHLILADGELCAEYAVSGEEMVACLERVKTESPGLRHVVCRIRGVMEYDNDTMCNLMDFHYHAKSQDNVDAASTSATDATIEDGEIQYHLCSGAVQMLFRALWQHVENRPSVERLFDEFHADMFSDEETEMGSDM